MTKKFEAAFDYLKDYTKSSYKYYVLNDEGSHSPQCFSWCRYNIGLLADFKARMSIFYSDLSCKSDDAGQRKNGFTIDQMPKIKKEKLHEAIEELSVTIRKRGQ